MIDLHCHILPGIDDGPRSIEESLALAERAVAGGTKTIVATPHVREDHPFELEQIASGVEEVNRALSAAGLALEVVGGGELALSKAVDLDDEELRTVALGPGPYVLVESPYGPMGEVLERTIFDVQLRGLRPVLAHPERSPAFIPRMERLAGLVERGVLCSITAGSLVGRFGRTVKRFSAGMLAEGLVHNVASDAHDASGRPPLADAELGAAEAELDALRGQVEWLTREVPAAILRGEKLPPRPEPAMTRRPLLGRLGALLRRS